MSAPGGRAPRIGVTLGDPRGIGPEVAAQALAAVLPTPSGREADARFVVFGPPAAFELELADHPAVRFEPVEGWSPGDDAKSAGRVSLEAIERGVDAALAGELDGLVTAPISKAAIAEAGAPWPGHTELLRERCGVPDVTMIMGAEQTPLGGALRIALLTVHVPLREVAELLAEPLVERRARLAHAALRDWWEIPAPRLAFAGVNPHASEDGLFGDEEARVLAPVVGRLAADGVDVSGPFPADTVFRRAIAGEADLVVAPYHDVGLAVLKTIAPEHGINVTAGLPFPRTSPDHGTAFDIAGRNVADARSMRAALDACLRFSAAVIRAERNERA